MKTKAIYKVLTTITIVILALLVLAIVFDVVISSNYPNNLDVKNFVDTYATNFFISSNFVGNYVLYMITSILFLFVFIRNTKKPTFEIGVNGFVNLAVTFLLLVGSMAFPFAPSSVGKALLEGLKILDLLPFIFFNVTVILNFFHYILMCCHKENDQNVVSPKTRSLFNFIFRPFTHLKSPIDFFKKVERPLKTKQIKNLTKTIFALNVIIMVFDWLLFATILYSLIDVYFLSPTSGLFLLALVSFLSIPYLYLTIPAFVSCFSATLKMIDVLFTNKRTSPLLLSESFNQHLVMCIPYSFLLFPIVSSFIASIEFEAIVLLIACILVTVSLIVSLVVHLKLMRGYNLHCDLNIITHFQDDEFLAPVDQDGNVIRNQQDFPNTPVNNAPTYNFQNQPQTPPPHPDLANPPVEKPEDPFEEFSDNGGNDSKPNE